VLKGFGPGHTDTDVTVYFTKADVMALSDIFWNGVYPFIDGDTGGSIDGMIRLVNASLEHVTDKTIIVPGHGPVGNRAKLIEFRDMLVGIPENVARLKKQGKSLDEVIAAKPTAAYDAKWGGFVIDPAFFTRLVYTGL
jgi:glyoxylase-like metal-dependent hydrolase (beta-lactamase superfamily II)